MVTFWGSRMFDNGFEMLWDFCWADVFVIQLNVNKDPKYLVDFAPDRYPDHYSLSQVNGVNVSTILVSAPDDHGLEELKWLWLKWV